MTGMELNVYFSSAKLVSNALRESVGLLPLKDHEFKVEGEAMSKNLGGGIEMENQLMRGDSEKEFYNPTRQVMFRAGLLACREYMARFVEAQDASTAASIRANWWPSLGSDPGVPRQLRFDEVTDGGEEGPWPMKPIDPSTEALPVALAFLIKAGSNT